MKDLIELAQIDIPQQAIQFYAQVKISMEKYNTYQLHLCGRLIEVSQYTSVNDYHPALEVCNRAIKFFSAKNFDANVPL